MGLVDYASDDSEADNGPDSMLQSVTAPVNTKPVFQKVVNRSNPHKIKVNLPGATGVQTKQVSGQEAEPEPKRIKLGGGGSRGINAFLPAPKRPAANFGSNNQGGSISRNKSIAPGISLKTGAEPAFSREPMSMPPPASGTGDLQESKDATAVNEMADLGIRASSISPVNVKPQGRATRFMPLSVSRRPKAKLQNRPPSRAAQDGNVVALDGLSAFDSTRREPAATVSSQSRPKPAISLFSTETSGEDTVGQVESTRDSYEPLFGDTQEEKSSGTSRDTATSLGIGTSVAPNAQPLGDTAQSLDSIASDLNLSAAERRQLFGRGGRGGAQGAASAINVVNFNTDAEYAANEEMRAAGELPEQSHRVVKTINASGKNSLKSLVNVVNTQADALEEHFAKGRRNKQEAGNKYGW